MRRKAGGWLGKLAPAQWVGHVTELDAEELKRQGIRGLLLDLDNTLTDWRSREVAEEIRKWVEGAKAAGLALCIVSNSSKRGRVREVAEKLGIPWWASPAGKPFGAAVKRGLSATQTQPAETALVGDQLLTDMLAANLGGVKGIFAKPLSRNEFIGTRLMRLVEAGLIAWLRRRGLLPEGFPSY